MRRALVLAQRGHGHVEPNPMVGAVLAKQGKIVAQGYHQAFGEPHAEVNALCAARDAGIDITTCDLYVTLEPCCHHGKTPPCTQVILQSPPARVIVAMQDPFPQVAGKGINQLRAAGVRVEVGCMQHEAQRVLAPFTKRVTTGLPWVSAKWAQTIDGRIATASGHSQWISCERSRKLTHQWRGASDAIMTGIGTALADDPLLTARGVRVRRTAMRVVVDPRLELPIKSKLVSTARQTPLLVATHESLLRKNDTRATALQQHGAALLALPPLADKPSHLDLRPLLLHLSQEHQATNVLVEGGGRLIGSLMSQNLLDELRVFVAPRIMGDAGAVPAVAGLSPLQVSDAPQLALQEMRQIENDVLLTYHRQQEPRDEQE